MSIQIQGNSGVVWDTDGTTFRTGKVTTRPIDYGSGGIYRVSATSGTIGASLSAASEVFQFRYVSAASRVAVVYAVSGFHSIIVAVPGAAVASMYELVVARAWTSAGTGGTRLTMTGNNAKMRTSMATSEVNDIGIPTTAALSAGTKTLDTQGIGGMSAAMGTVGLTSMITTTLHPKTYFLRGDEGGLCCPLVLANQEGFIIRNIAAQSSTATYNVQFEVLWAEVPTF